MLQITPQNTIYLATKPVDFRKGIDSLVSLCRLKLSQDPFSGSIFVFTNRKRCALKILVYDGQGFWLCMKRLSKGQFSWWKDSTLPLCSLTAKQLTVLLWNGDPTLAEFGSDFRPIPKQHRPLDY